MLPEPGESSETVSSKSQEEIEDVHQIENKNSMIIDRFKQNLFKKVKPKEYVPNLPLEDKDEQDKPRDLDETTNSFSVLP